MFIAFVFFQKNFLPDLPPQKKLKQKTHSTTATPLSVLALCIPK